MAHPRLLRVFQEHERALVAFMAARLRCRFTAHDLAQELFLKLSALEGGLEVSNARAYLFRMAANLVTDHQRREQRRAGLLAAVEAHLRGGAETLSPERRVMAQQELRDLVQVVERLTPTTRRIFKLNRFDGLTQREIAQALGISQTAVEKHIRKALATLAAHRHEP
ncbi:MAG: RNA polymerase sigma factor [Kiloniellales bacterium]